MSRRSLTKVEEAAWLTQRTANAMTFGVDVEARRIYLVGDIDDSALYRVIVGLQGLDATDGPITLILSSGGGSEPAGYGIYDAIRLAQNPVVIIGIGVVQSIASLILQAGDMRFLTPEARFMVHNGSVELHPGVDSDTLIAIGKEVEKNNHRYHAILAARSGQKIDWVRAACQDETYFSADEAVKYGFADKVLQRPEPQQLPKQRKKAKKPRRKS